MAYTTGTLNPMTQLGPLENNFKLWAYLTADSESTVKGAAYFSDAGKKGLKLGDVIMVVNQAAGSVACAFVQISSVTGTGYAQTATASSTVVVT